VFIERLITHLSVWNAQEPERTDHRDVQSLSSLLRLSSDLREYGAEPLALQ